MVRRLLSSFLTAPFLSGFPKPHARPSTSRPVPTGRSSLRLTPAMAAGIANHIWTIEEIVRLVPEPVAKKRGAYKPRQPKAAISN